VLEANYNLTWRDMQHLVVKTSNPTPLLHNSGWIRNGVGRQVSSKFGYGLMDAEKLVRAATVWKTVPPQHICTYEFPVTEPHPRALRGRFAVNSTLTVSGCTNGHAVNYLEQVHAVLTIKFSRRGDLRVSLISPAGTRSLLLPRRPHDINRSGFHKWPFLSVQQWGEDPRGVWTLEIENVGSARNRGSFHDWSLTFYGTATPPPSDPDVAQLMNPSSTGTESGARTTEGIGRSSSSSSSWVGTQNGVTTTVRAEPGGTAHSTGIIASTPLTQYVSPTGAQIKVIQPIQTSDTWTTVQKPVVWNDEISSSPPAQRGFTDYIKAFYDWLCSID
jgi:subtilisin-like proprotein convertase family protein